MVPMHTPFAPRESLARWMAAGLWGLLAGSACQMLQARLWDWEPYAGMVVLAMGVVWWVLRRPGGRAGRFLVLLLAGSVAAFGMTGLRAVLFQSQGLDPVLEGRDIRVTGVVTAMPQWSDAGARFRLSVESALLDDRAVRLPPGVSLGWYTGNPGPSADGAALELQRQPVPLQAGERWQMTVRLKAPHGNSNPHGFDYELWMWGQGLQATGYVRSGASDRPAVRLGQTGRHPVELARQSVRDRILAYLEDRRAAGLIAALVVGDQNAIERADWDVFRATGVAHLMSISGLHVTMFAWVAAALVGAAWRRSAWLCLRLPAPHAALIGGMLLALAYAVFSGWGIPSQRTVWMLATVGLLRLSGRYWPWPMVWLLVCAVVVAIDPWALTQAGFWLSFVAVGVLFATGSGGAAQAPGGMWQHARALLREQSVVTVALTPLSLLLFGQVSMVGLLANLVAIPWVTLVVTPLSMLGVLVPAVWVVCAWCIEVLGVWLQWLAQWPWATLSVAQAPLWAGAAGVLGGLLLVLRAPWSMRLAGLPLLLPALLWQAPRPAPGEFSILAADIGQGNAVLVQTAGHALLYDAGPRFSRESDAGHRVLVPLLRALDVRLDLMVLSHRDNDHVGGAPAVLAMHPAAGLLSSIAEDHALQALAPVQRCQAGQSWRWDGVEFTVLHPLDADYQTTTRPNALSCVLRIASLATGPDRPSRVVLLAGDIERAQEARLVGDGAPLRSDVLLAPHHGSKTSSSAVFLDAVAPRVVLVQAGYRNRFGHPAEPPMTRYRERHILVFDSPHCGAATWQSDTPMVVRCQRIEGLRYWHHTAP